MNIVTRYVNVIYDIKQPFLFFLDRLLNATNSSFSSVKSLASFHLYMPEIFLYAAATQQKTDSYIFEFVQLEEFNRGNVSAPMPF